MSISVTEGTGPLAGVTVPLPTFAIVRTVPRAKFAVTVPFADRETVVLARPGSATTASGPLGVQPEKA